jgi:hypothetical protein
LIDEPGCLCAVVTLYEPEPVAKKSVDPTIERISPVDGLVTSSAPFDTRSFFIFATSSFNMASAEA